MANNFRDSFERSRKTVGNAFRQDILRNRDTADYPETLDGLAGRIAKDGTYPLNVMRANQQVLTRPEFAKLAPEPYLRGLAQATGESEYRRALADHDLGGLIVEYAGLIEGLKNLRNQTGDDRFDAAAVDPGEVLGRYVARKVQREKSGREALAALDFRGDTRTPRELVEQMCAHPDLADTVINAVPSGSQEGESIVYELGEVQLTSELWDHQRTALVKWLEAGANGYVNMATATGKTVLGLAAVGYCTPNGSLHPTDTGLLLDHFEKEDADGLPIPTEGRADDILIVTTDDLLGVQWGRLFQEHCNTPAEFTRVIDQRITLPWGTVEIRSAAGIDDLDPGDYRLALFDEVHNYSSSSGWGRNLARFIDSDCPVLALTGSVSDDIRARFEQADGEFPEVYTYDHAEAKADGIIPDFEWVLSYCPIDSSRSNTLAKLQTASREYGRRIDTDGATYWLTERALKELGDAATEALHGEFSTPISLARALKDTDDSPDAPTEKLDALASALLGRQTNWWNLRINLDVITERIEDAMDRERPTLVLTRSYDESEQVKEAIQDRLSSVRIITLDGDRDASAQDKQIQQFDEISTGRKILVGPGDRIGTGNDIQSVEVGINLARPGSGVSSSLVQRLGRLLRNADKETVEFYHVMGLPPENAIAPSDGKRFVRNTVGFFAQAIEPDGDGGISKIPAIELHSDTVAPIRALESHGRTAVRATSAQLDKIENAYVTSIETNTAEHPVIGSEWWRSVDRLDAATVSRVEVGPASSRDEETAVASDSDPASTDEQSTRIEEKSRTTGGDAEAHHEPVREQGSPVSQTSDVKREGFTSGEGSSSADDSDDLDGTEPHRTDRGGVSEREERVDQRPSTITGNDTMDTDAIQAPTDSNGETKTVEVDGVLVGLVDMAVANENNRFTSREEIVAEALGNFIAPTIQGDRSGLTREITSERLLNVTADPILSKLLHAHVNAHAEINDRSELIQSAILKSLGVSSHRIAVDIPDYQRFEFAVTYLLQSEDCSYETVDTLVHAALESQFEISRPE